VGAPLALIGEAPSAHGARFSGIAFTAERSLPPDQRTSTLNLQPKGFAEHSATVVRRALEAVEIDPTRVLLWNAVPFHPRHPDDPLKNRQPDTDELALGDKWLERFSSLMSPRATAAVGRWAQTLRPNWTPLRHPANGGGPELRAGLARLAADLDLRGG
jgi:uracil-DNA glycosylase